jgi:hypothetical protein
VDIPTDGISKEVQVTLPSLNLGHFKLTVSLSSGSKILGENSYEILTWFNDRKKRTP